MLTAKLVLGILLISVLHATKIFTLKKRLILVVDLIVSVNVSKLHSIAKMVILKIKLHWRVFSAIITVLLAKVVKRQIAYLVK